MLLRTLTLFSLATVLLFPSTGNSQNWDPFENIEKNYGDIRVKGWVHTRVRKFLKTEALEIKAKVETKVHGRSKRGRGHVHVALVDLKTKTVVKSWVVSKYASTSLTQSSKTKSEEKIFTHSLSGIAEPWILVSPSGNVKTDVPLTGKDAIEWLKKNVSKPGAEVWDQMKKAGDSFQIGDIKFRKVKR